MVRWHLLHAALVLRSHRELALLAQLALPGGLLRRAPSREAAGVRVQFIVGLASPNNKYRP